MCFIVLGLLCFWDFLINFFFFWVFLGMACTWETWDLKFFRHINRVLESRFSSGRHVKKTSRQTWLDHENWVFKTWFIGQNRVFVTWDVNKIYTFETMSTNYIVGKMGLIPNFDLFVLVFFFFLCSYTAAPLPYSLTENHRHLSLRRN